MPGAAFARTEIEIYQFTHGTHVYLHQIRIAFGTFPLRMNQAVITINAFNVLYRSFFGYLDCCGMGKHIQIWAHIQNAHLAIQLFHLQDQQVLVDEAHFAMRTVRIEEAAAFQDLFGLRKLGFLDFLRNTGIGEAMLLQLKIVVKVIHSRRQIFKFNRVFFTTGTGSQRHLPTFFQMKINHRSFAFAADFSLFQLLKTTGAFEQRNVSILDLKSGFQIVAAVD